ncbi:hypothetical protein HDU88_005846 [Geranomyces variabilis]|nr:hypothetical protein HDU88_005846 [Geranomyces variabilis]
MSRPSHSTDRYSRGRDRDRDRYREDYDPYRPSSSSSSRDYRSRSAHASPASRSRSMYKEERTSDSYRSSHYPSAVSPPPPPPPLHPASRGHRSNELIPYDAGMGDDSLAQSQTVIVPRIQQGALDGSHAISTLGRWCDRTKLPAPEYTLSSTAPFSAKLLIAGVEFNTEGFPTKAEAKRTVAWAAVEHFKRAGEPFFVDESTSIDWVSALMTHCAVNNLGKVHIDIHIVCDDPPQYAARVSFGGRILEYPDLPQNTKQTVKAQAAKRALEAIKSGTIPHAAPVRHHVQSNQIQYAQVPYSQITAMDSTAPAYIKQERDFGLKQPLAYNEGGNSAQYDPALPTTAGDSQQYPYAGHSSLPPSHASDLRQPYASAEQGHHGNTSVDRWYNGEASSSRKHPRDEDGSDNSHHPNRRPRPHNNRYNDNSNNNAASASSAGVVQSLLSSLVWGNTTKRNTHTNISTSGSEDEPDTPAAASALNASPVTAMQTTAAVAVAGASSSSSLPAVVAAPPPPPTRFQPYTGLLDIACFQRGLPAPVYADLPVAGGGSNGGGGGDVESAGYRCLATVDGKSFECARVHEKRETAREDVAGDAYKWLLKRE